MPTVEGLTPQVLWTTIYGLLALCILFMVVYKVYDAVRTIVERRKQRQEAKKPDFAEEVSQKVIDKLEPRFKRIEENLARDKERLDSHDSIISETKKVNKEIGDGLVAICKYLMASTRYSNLESNSPKLDEATEEMTNYLTSKIGGTK